MTKDEVLRLALEALEYFSDTSPNMAGKAHAEDAITAIKAALEAKDEPVAWWIPKHKAPDMVSKVRWSDECEPLYTTPPQRKPLTVEEIEALAKKHIAVGTRSFQEFARRIEAAHGIKGEA